MGSGGTSTVKSFLLAMPRPCRHYWPMKDRKQLTEVRTAAGRAGGLASAKLGNQKAAGFASWSPAAIRKRAENLLKKAAKSGAVSTVTSPKT